MRILATAIGYVLALVLVAALAFVCVLLLTGPHAGLLPTWLEPVILGLGWLAVLVLPALIARRVWRRCDRAERGASVSRRGESR